MSRIPRAPTFPAVPAEIQEVEEEPIADYKNISARDRQERSVPKQGSIPAPARHIPKIPVAPRSASMDTTSTSSSGVPVVPLPVAKSRSRIKNILLWRNPKVTGLIFASEMLFFYFTLYRQQSILAVFGGLLTMYLIVGIIVVNVNKMAGGQLDKYIKRPAVEVPIFKKETVNFWAETLMDEGNDIGGYFRNVLYCDNNKLTMSWIFVALTIYIVGKYFSLLPVFFVVFLLSFSLPLVYEKNQKDFDAVLSKVADVASKHLEKTHKYSVEQATKVRDIAAKKLEQGPPAARSLADKIRSTPAKKSM